MGDPRQGALRGLEAEFELVRELGRGGSAVVYLAIERELGREVAIKTVHPVFATDPDAAARLVREARTLARLQHPNIVTFYGVRRLADGGLAMVMQYVRGERLRDRIHAVGPLSVEETRRILADVALALAHAHQHHVVHRDIKPENIYLDAEVGLARLSDFGIARPWDQDGSLTQEGLAIGTPAYMAPEQIDGGALDARSDIYSLGLVAHEMLSGRRPWDGHNLYGIIYRQKHEFLPRLTDLRPDVPVELAAAVETALAKRPDQRWPDAESFLAAILASPGSAVPRPPIMAGPAAAPAVEHAPAARGEDAPTIPYRPAEVLGAAGAGTREAGRGASLTRPGAGDALAAAERALAELEGASPANERSARRRYLAAVAVVAVVGGGIGTVSWVRARYDRDGRGPEWTSVRLQVPPPVATAQAAAPVVDVPVSRAAEPRRPDPTTMSPEPARTVGERPRREPVVAEGAALPGTGRVTPPRPPSPEPDQGPSRPAPTILGRRVDAAAPAPSVAAPPPAAPVTQPPASTAVTRLQDISAGPVYTAFTVAPELKNQAEVAGALAREYPRLRSAGSPRGQVLIWLLLDDSGTVRKVQLKESSGHTALDDAAVRLGHQMQFSPALDHDRAVPAWVAVPVDFVNR